MEKRNIVLLWIRDALIYVASGFTSVSTVLFLAFGMTEAEISIRGSVIGITTMATGLLFPNFSNRLKSLPRWAGITYFAGAIGVLLCTVPGLIAMEHRWMIAFMISAGIFYAAVNALESNVDYKLPFQVISMDDFPRLSAGSGVIGGVLTIAIGAVVSWMYTVSSDSQSTGLLCYFLGGTAFLASGWMNLLLKPLPTAKTEVSAEDVPPLWITVKRLWQNQLFRRLIGPHLLQGFGASLIGSYALIAIFTIDLADNRVMILNLLGSVGLLLGSLAFGALGKKIGFTKFAVVCSILLLILLPSLRLGWIPMAVLFFIMSVANSGKTVSTNTVLVQHLSAEESSSFRSFANALVALGGSVGSLFVGFSLGKIPGEIILLIGIASEIAMTVSYAAVFREKNREERL